MQIEILKAGISNNGDNPEFAVDFPFFVSLVHPVRKQISQSASGGKAGLGRDNRRALVSY